MNLADAYNQINKPINKTQPRTTLAIKPNSQVISLFQQAVALVEANKWIKSCPREINKENYYFFLKFFHDGECIRAIREKAKRPIFSVEKIVKPNDVFQYKNHQGELDMYIRPSTSRYIRNFDCSDCYDDKKALNKFKEALKDENWVMRNLFGEQEHVFLDICFHTGSDYPRHYQIVLFRDGNAYYFNECYQGLDHTNPYLGIIEFDLAICHHKEDLLVKDIAGCIKSLNCNGNYGAGIKPPVAPRTAGLGIEHGFYIDYFVYTRKSYPAVYHTPKDKMDRYMKEERCSYCGGPFEGAFKRKCQVCGKKKDY